MTTTIDGQDLFLRFEGEVRSPKDTLLVDAFLPPAEAIPSALRRPAAPRPAPDPAPEPDLTGTLTGAQHRADEGPEEPPAPPARRRPVRRAAEPEKSLEEEIADFMSRSSRALAPDTDPDGS
jgi:hypothetical protein